MTRKNFFTAIIYLIFATIKHECKNYNVMNTPTYDGPDEKKTIFFIMLRDIYLPIYPELLERFKINTKENTIKFIELLRYNIEHFLKYFLNIFLANGFDKTAELIDIFKSAQTLPFEEKVKTNNIYTFGDILMLMPHNYLEIIKKDHLLKKKLEPDPQFLKKYLPILNMFIIKFIYQNVKNTKFSDEIYNFLICVTKNYKIFDKIEKNKNDVRYNQLDTPSCATFDITDADCFYDEIRNFYEEIIANKYINMNINIIISLDEIFALLVLRIPQLDNSFNIKMFKELSDKYFGRLDEVLTLYKAVFTLYLPVSVNLNFKFYIECDRNSFFDRIVYFLLVIKNITIPQILSHEFEKYFQDLENYARTKLINFEKKLNAVKENYKQGIKIKTENKNKHESMRDLKSLIIEKYINFKKKSYIVANNHENSGETYEKKSKKNNI